MQLQKIEKTIAISILLHKNKCFKINLKYISVTWLFKMAESLWVIINCTCVDFPKDWYAACIHWHWDLMVLQLHETEIFTNWQGGLSKLKKGENWSQFTGVHFPDRNRNSYDISNIMKFDLNVSKAKFITSFHIYFKYIFIKNQSN